jgi:hypothetical protein
MVGATLAVALALALDTWWNLSIRDGTSPLIARKRAERKVELMADDENDNNIEEGA